MNKSLILMSGCLNRLPVLPVQYIGSVPSVDELEKKQTPITPNFRRY